MITLLKSALAGLSIIEQWVAHGGFYPPSDGWSAE